MRKPFISIRNLVSICLPCLPFNLSFLRYVVVVSRNANTSPADSFEKGFLNILDAYLRSLSVELNSSNKLFIICMNLLVGAQFSNPLQPCDIK